jgi:hypothetical protein
MLRLICFSGVLLAAGCASTPAPLPAGPSAADADSPHGQTHEASIALGDSPVWQPPTGPQEGVVFTCPHHPEVVSEVPGVCPKCHMDLLPTEKENAGAASPGPHSEQAGDPSHYACPHHPEVMSDTPGTCSKCGGMALVPVKPTVSADAVKTVYACPHHPEVTSDRPGTCSKCGGMALVPVKKETRP